MARYELLEPDKLTPAQKALHDAIIGNRKRLGGPFSVLLHNPKLGDALNKVVRALREEGKLDKRLYELIVLVVTRYWSASYPWAVHEAPALNAGITKDAVEAIRARRKPALTKSDEAAVYQAVTELLENKKLSDSTYQSLVKEVGFDMAIDIVATIGLYSTVSNVVNAFEVPTPNGEKPF